MMHVALARTSAHPSVFVGSPKRTYRVGWSLIVLRPRLQPLSWIATVRISCTNASYTQEFQLVHPLAKSFLGVKLGVLFLGDHATQFSVRLYNAADTSDTIDLTLLPIPPFLAAIGTYLQNPSAFWGAFRGMSGSWATRVRKGIAAAAFEGQHVKTDYRLWTWYFDTWSNRRLQQIVGALPARPSVSALVLYGTQNGAALAATLASMRAQTYALAAHVVARPGEAEAMHSATASDYVIVLQAGEVLPRHALLLLMDEVGRQETDALLADEDSIGLDGTRSDPWFKPQPSLTMMCSGLLSRGVWLVRSSVLRQVLASATLPGWAECIRLAVWFTLHAAGRAGRVRRVPRVLTHRRADAEAAPYAALAQVIDTFLVRLGVQATVEPRFPLRLHWHWYGDGSEMRKVSLIIPSQLRGDVQLRCLLNILADTTYPDFEMLVVVTQDSPLDELQSRAAERLRAAGPVHVEVLRQASFNYSLANNFGALRTEGTFICLLNDDVSTLEGDWLDRMVAVFSDKDVGIVGAKLYYPDMTTQHGGVIMGLAGLAEHSNRLLPRGTPGYMWRGILDQELSAVTGACLLVRRDVFEQVGGLDEVLPTGFNDVDFCLRARALKYSVVMAASIELVHHETLSFGHHYKDATDKELADVARMQERWPEVCAADPFHNPNLSLTTQSEWTLAWPPRVSLGEHCQDGPT